MSGIYVRKVQRIGGQNIVNIPRDICAHLEIKRGDLVCFSEVVGQSAVMFKTDFDRIAALRRQEVMAVGKGKDDTGAGTGAEERGAGAGGDTGDSVGGGSSEAEGGDGGERGVSDERDSNRDLGPEGGSEKVAGDESGGGAEGGDNTKPSTRGADNKPELREPLEQILGRVTPDHHERK